MPGAGAGGGLGEHPVAAGALQRVKLDVGLPDTNGASSRSACALPMVSTPWRDDTVST
jgi:hypothetical protein